LTKGNSSLMTDRSGDQGLSDEMRKPAQIAVMIAGLALVAGAVVYFVRGDRAPEAPAVASRAPQKPKSKAGIPAPPPADEGVTIPAEFQGEWNEDLKDCGTGLALTRLRVTPREVRFHESLGKVVMASRRQNVVTLLLDMSGEGEEWQTTMTFTLTPDGNAMTTNGPPALTRRRCPAQAAP